MLNLALLKQTMRENRRLWCRCTLILVLGILICECVYGTETGEKIRQFLSVIPGMTGRVEKNGDQSMIAFLGLCLFGAFFFMVPAVYSVLGAVRLISGRMEDGSMATLVSVIGNRSVILFTQSYWMVVSLLGMFLCTSTAGILGGAILKPGRLETAQFLLLNLGSFCFHVMISGFCFFLACLVKKRERASMALAGILAAAYLIFALPDLSSSLSAVGYLSVFSAFQPGLMIQGSVGLFWQLPLFAAVGLLLFQAGSMVLVKADIPS
ncbi:MAG: hypothetical protein SOZ59_10075 [Candidatus Limivivens sp.]|nr:hypothetical protein [Candidatus Limivivens sp.]